MTTPKRSDLKYDEEAKIYYLPHDSERYDYYCPECHLEHYPQSDDEFRPWDVVATFIWNGRQTDPYTYRELIADEELNRRLENGRCLFCGKDAPYMTASPRECKELGDFRFCERPAPPPEEMVEA
jgi:hypothetical protein